MPINDLENYSDFLTPQDIQKILKLSRNTVYKLVESGTIKSFKVGRHYRIPKSCLLDFINGSQNQPCNN